MSSWEYADQQKSGDRQQSFGVNCLQAGGTTKTKRRHQLQGVEEKQRGVKQMLMDIIQGMLFGSMSDLAEGVQIRDELRHEV